jgi:hypothetical protein
MTVRPGKFSLDDPAIYDGYTGGDTWNGFATPVFTLDQSHKVLTETLGTRIAPAIFVETIRNSTGNEWTYDPDTDEFKIYDYNHTDGQNPPGIDGVTVVKGEDYKTADGQTVRLYDVSSCWCWFEEEEELKKMLVLITLKPSKNTGYKDPFPQHKPKDQITEIRRDIRVCSQAGYDSMNQNLLEYAGRRGAKATVKIIADNLTIDQIRMIHNTSKEFL